MRTSGNLLIMLSVEGAGAQAYHSKILRIAKWEGKESLLLYKMI